MNKSHLLGAVCAYVICTVSFSVHSVGIPGQGTWETTLQARDFDGNMNTVEAYYDTVLNITWLADATAYSKMESMFFDTLGNLAYYDTSVTFPQTGWGLSNTGDFEYLQSSYYRS